jgi:hypothetical protein
MVQRDEAWVGTASAEDLSAAQRAGELAHYLGGQTAAESALAVHVAGTRDRVQAAAFGLAPHGAGRGDLDSTWFEAKRRAMTPEQLEKLTWVESSTPAEVYAAEQAGELNALLGRAVDPDTSFQK